MRDCWPRPTRSRRSDWTERDRGTILTSFRTNVLSLSEVLSKPGTVHTRGTVAGLVATYGFRSTPPGGHLPTTASAKAADFGRRMRPTVARDGGAIHPWDGPMNVLARPVDAPTAQAGGTHAPGCRFVPLGCGRCWLPTNRVRPPLSKPPKPTQAVTHTSTVPRPGEPPSTVPPPPTATRVPGDLVLPMPMSYAPCNDLLPLGQDRFRIVFSWADFNAAHEVEESGICIRGVRDRRSSGSCLRALAGQAPCRCSAPLPVPGR